MEKVFPGIRESFEGGASWSWDDDPWTRGGYIAPGPGHSALMPDIVRAEGRIHFAGEHTASNPFGGSMSGALEGAVRAVLEVLEAPVAAPV
jgi:monoamine oxidase